MGRRAPTRPSRQVVLRFMEHLPTQDAVRAVAKKLAPPLITLLSSEPEMQAPPHTRARVHDHHQHHRHLFQ